MELKLTGPACAMLWKMFCVPQTLDQDRPYAAADALAATEVTAISRWLLTKVFKKEGDRYVWEAGWSGRIKDRYRDRLQDVAKHYEKSGRVIVNCESYMDLLNSLEGKGTDSDSVEE